MYKNTVLGLVIAHSHCKLPEKDTDFFYFESPHGENIEGGAVRQSFRLFIPKHPQHSELIEKLGSENTFTFFRVLFSFFDAAYMLYDFIRKHRLNTVQLNLEDIENNSKCYDINNFNYHSLEQPTYLSLYDYEHERHVEKFSFPPSEFQELFWSMNLEKILSNYGITFFPPSVFSMEERNTGNLNLLVNKMIRNREVGMVMHTWRKLLSYDRADFISNISNILEFIKKDLQENEDTFDMNNDEFVRLKELINYVSVSKRQLFFGIFNSSNLLGFLSRHGPKRLIDFEKINDTDALYDIKKIRENMNLKIIPTRYDINHMFNYWHYTTSLIVSLWFRLKITT